MNRFLKAFEGQEQKDRCRLLDLEEESLFSNAGPESQSAGLQNYTSFASANEELSSSPSQDKKKKTPFKKESKTRAGQGKSLVDRGASKVKEQRRIGELSQKPISPASFKSNSRERKDEPKGEKMEEVEMPKKPEKSQERRASVEHVSSDDHSVFAQIMLGEQLVSTKEGNEKQKEEILLGQVNHEKSSTVSSQLELRESASIADKKGSGDKPDSDHRRNRKSRQHQREVSPPQRPTNSRKIDQQNHESLAAQTESPSSLRRASMSAAASPSSLQRASSSSNLRRASSDRNLTGGQRLRDRKTQGQLDAKTEKSPMRGQRRPMRGLSRSQSNRSFILGGRHQQNEKKEKTHHTSFSNLADSSDRKKREHRETKGRPRSRQQQERHGEKSRSSRSGDRGARSPRVQRNRNREYRDTNRRAQMDKLRSASIRHIGNKDEPSSNEGQSARSSTRRMNQKTDGNKKKDSSNRKTTITSEKADSKRLRIGDDGTSRSSRSHASHKKNNDSRGQLIVPPLSMRETQKKKEGRPTMTEQEKAPPSPSSTIIKIASQSQVSPKLTPPKRFIRRLRSDRTDAGEDTVFSWKRMMPRRLSASIRKQQQPQSATATTANTDVSSVKDGGASLSPSVVERDLMKLKAAISAANDQEVPRDAFYSSPEGSPAEDRSRHSRHLQSVLAEIPFMNLAGEKSVFDLHSDGIYDNDEGGQIGIGNPGMAAEEYSRLTMELNEFNFLLGEAKMQVKRLQKKTLSIQGQIDMLKVENPMLGVEQ